MSNTQLIAIACTAGLAVGCGSSAKTHTHRRGPSRPASPTSAGGPPMATIGPAGTLGPASGAGYDAAKSGVLFKIRVALVRFLTSKGFSGVTVYCKGVNAGTASCTAAGMNRSNQKGSNVLTVSLDPSTGALRITHVGS